MEKSLIHKGSVKDVYEADGHVLFEFSDRYSIFDWGEMPEQIKNKGFALCATGMAFFDWLSKPDTWKNTEIPEKTLYRASALETLNKLQKDGVRSHIIGMVDKTGDILTADQNKKTRSLKVSAVDVVEPNYSNNKYDYQFYQKAPTQCLIPLEVIFRFGVPKGSSLIKRASNEKYLKKLGLLENISEGDIFSFPIIEFSTKLESKDRYISYEEAQQIAGLHDNEFRLILNTAQLLALKLKEFFAEIDIELWDGKFEFAFVASKEEETRDIMLVDSIGPDELRLTYKGVQLSKEVLRQFYSKSDWKKNLDKSKKMAKERGVREWKKICTDELESHPEPLGDKMMAIISQMYMCLCNSITQKSWDKKVFDNAKEMEDVVKHLVIAAKKGTQ